MGVQAQVRVFFVVGWLDSEIGLETFHSLINIQRTDVCELFCFVFIFFVCAESSLLLVDVL